MPITKAQIVQQLRSVKSPGGREDIVAAGMIQNVAVCEGFVNVKILHGAADAGATEGLREAIVSVVTGMGDEIQKVGVDFVRTTVKCANTHPRFLILALLAVA